MSSTLVMPVSSVDLPVSSADVPVSSVDLPVSSVDVPVSSVDISATGRHIWHGFRINLELSEQAPTCVIFDQHLLVAASVKR